jgi:hypothetical protein
VSADRCFVIFDGSGSPVRGATGPAFFVGGFVVVVETVLVEVVVDVESARALDANTTFENKARTNTSTSDRRIEETYNVREAVSVDIRGAGSTLKWFNAANTRKGIK